MCSAARTSFGRRTSANAYCLYGLRLTSPWPLPCPDGAESGLPGVELFEGPPKLFSETLAESGVELTPEKWDYYARLRDGTEYVRWNQLFEFVISTDGRRIAAHPIGQTSWEVFQTYLLGQVFSYSLIKLGLEPLHATVVVVDGSAVAFLGDTGYGKSSLGAAFLQAGYPLLTDDLLVAREAGGCFLAYPGPARIKLFPEIAETFLKAKTNGTLMNPFTTKLVIPLEASQYSREARPLRAMYLLQPPRATSQGKRVTIRKRSQRQACLDLISNTFNTEVVHPDRLAQQFSLATQLAASVPFKSLSYPRDLSRLPAVVDRICADLP